MPLTVRPRSAAVLLTCALALVTPAAAQVPAGGEFQVNTWTTDDQQLPSIAAGPDGSFVVAWESRPVCIPVPPQCGVGQDGHRSGVFAQRYDAAGARIGAEFQVNQTTAYDQTAPAIASLYGGRFVVVWTSMIVSVGPATMARLLDRTGQPAGAEFMVAGPYALFGALPWANVTGAATGFAVAWWGDADALRVRRFAADGAPVGDEYQANTQPTPYWGGRPGLGGDLQGNFTVAWMGADAAGSDVRARRFGPAGPPAAPDFVVNAYTTGVQAHPDVETEPGGTTLIVWEDASRDGYHGRRYNPVGDPIGSEFQVGAVTIANSSPAVAADRVGGFLVTWPDLGASPPVIKARRYDPAGNGGPEFRVDSSPAAKGILPAAALDDASNAIVAWASVQDGSRFGVYAQRFGGLRPAAMVVDPAAGPASDGNGVFEPEETVGVETSWRNVTGAAALSFGGSALDFTSGYPGGVYSITDAAAAYPAVPDNAVARCRDASDCFALRVLAPNGRGMAHWDTVFREDLGPNAPALSKPWTVHLGDSFLDVPRSSPFYRFVETLIHNGVTGGCSANQYCPSAPTSREQMSVFALLARERFPYRPPACGATPLFADVPPTSPFCRWIEELARRGVVGGCGGGNYCPSSPVTREQMAVFALKTLEGAAYVPPACGVPMYTDVPAGSPFCPYVEELTRRSVVAGCGNGAYCPALPVSREQMSVFLGVTFGLQLYGP